MRWRLPWRRLRCARWAALGCGAFWITAFRISGPAQAAEPAPIQAQIEWQAATCGKPADFVARVSRRTRHVRFSATAQQLLLRVRIEPSGSGLRAEVTLQGADKPPVVRRIESPDCDDALDALALVVAIGIDQRWRELRGTRPPPRPRPAQRKPVREPASDPEGAQQGPKELLLELPAVTLSQTAPPVAPPPMSRAPAAPPSVNVRSPLPVRLPPPWSWALGGAARWTHGVAPESQLGGELWLRAAWERGSFWSPELGLSLLHDRSQAFSRPEGRADFALSAAALELCPLRLGVQRLGVQPCAVSSAGWLRASGRQTFRASTRVSPWAMVGAGAQVLARLGPLALRLNASVGQPLRRDRYRFDPSGCTSTECDAGPFHRVSPLVWSIALGAGVSGP